MSAFSYATSKEKKIAILFAILMGLTLAIGFLSSVHSFYNWVVPSKIQEAPSSSKIIEMFFFPLIAIFFHLSIPKKARFKSLSDLKIENLWLTIPVPFLIALLFGFVRLKYFSFNNTHSLSDFLWVVVCIPIGEELLFRGWIYNLAFRMFGRKLMSLSPSIPVISWVSAISFSLWHLQNYQSSSALFLIFQLVYTLFTGLWLCHLRWNVGQIWICVLAHLLLNLAAILPLILCYN